jgi:hypothetical protein
MMEQGSAEWLEARLGKATASRFSDILAQGRGGAESSSRRNYRAQLVSERLTSSRQDDYTNAAMQNGTETEPVARAAYEAHTGNVVQEVGFIPHQTLANIGASPDGLIGTDGGVEIKCPNTATHIDTLLGGMPSKHYLQVQGCLWVTGRKWWDFVSYDPRMPENLSLYIQRIELDEECSQKLHKEIPLFLAEVDELCESLLKMSIQGVTVKEVETMSARRRA